MQRQRRARAPRLLRSPRLLSWRSDVRRDVGTSRATRPNNDNLNYYSLFFPQGVSLVRPHERSVQRS